MRLARRTRTKYGLVCKVFFLALLALAPLGCGDSDPDLLFVNNGQGNGQPITLRSLEIVGGDVLNSPGSERPFTVQGTFSDNAVVDLTSRLVFTSSNPAVDVSAGNAVVNSGAARGTQAVITALDPSTGVKTSVTLTVGQYLYAVGGTESVEGFTIDPLTGILASIGNAVAGTMPRGAVLSPNGRFLYLTNQSSGTISSFSIDPLSGELAPIPGSPFPAGDGPILLAIEPGRGRFLFETTSSAAGDTLRVYSVNSETGALAMTSELGAADGVGTRANGLAVNPVANVVYVANRTSGNVSAFRYNDLGGATALAGSPFTAGAGAGMVAVDPSGRFAYVTNFEEATISGFSISATGALFPLPGSPFPTGASPQFLAFHPSGRFLYATAAAANTLISYAVDPVTGSLNTADVAEGLLTPRGLAVSPSGESLYVAEADGPDIYRLSLDGLTGSLTFQEETPTSFSRPFGILISP